MPRKTSRTTKIACQQKVRHPSREAAVAAAKSLKAKTGSWFRAYRCHVGMKGERRHWHVAHAIRVRKPGRAW